MYVDAGGDGVGLGVVVSGGAAVDALVLSLDGADRETRRDLVVRVVVRRLGLPRRVVDPDPRRMLKKNATLDSFTLSKSECERESKFFSFDLGRCSI